MPFNPYFPSAYPYQPIQQQQQSSIIWVSGEREAQMYPVAPNNAVTLWSQTESVVYLKSADATGKPSLKVYDLVERTQNAPATSSVPEGYVTKDELEAILSALRADVEQIKGDVYGLAGKKKGKKDDE